MTVNKKGWKMPKTGTLIVCGMFIILACIGSVTYLISTDRPTEVALGLITPIVIGVLGTLYNAAKIDGVSNQVAERTDAIHSEVNGKLDARMRKAITEELDKRYARSDNPETPNEIGDR